ncbi:MAG: tail fiber domain-containing protein [Bacteroidia bacterium]|nr:tail fiber domain-containing protein [Bacteroidia bacterium]
MDVISLGTNDPGMGAFRIFDASTYCTNRCLYPPFFLRTRLVGGQYLPRLHLYGDNPFHLLHLNLDDAAKPSTSTWTVLSDGRLKEVLGPYSKGLKHLLRLSAVEYRYKNPEDGQASSLFPSQVLEKVHVGFVAQEVASIFPEAVSRNDGGYLCLNIHPILVAYVNALKELHRRQIELESALLQMRDALREIERLREAVEVLRLQLSQKGKIEER